MSRGRRKRMLDKFSKCCGVQLWTTSLNLSVIKYTRPQKRLSNPASTPTEVEVYQSSAALVELSMSHGLIINSP